MFNKKSRFFIAFFILIFSCITYSQSVKDRRYELGGIDSLQNLRGTEFYPYPSDYNTDLSFKIKWKYRFNDEIKMIFTGDVNGDGLLEIVIFHETYISILDHKGIQSKIIHVPGENVSGGFIDDMDKDGCMDIIIGKRIYEKAVIFIYSFGEAEISKYIKEGTQFTTLTPAAVLNEKLFSYVFTDYNPPYPRGYTAFKKNNSDEIFHYKIGSGGSVISSISDLNNDGTYLLSNAPSNTKSGASGDGINHKSTLTNDSTVFIVVIDDKGEEIITSNFNPVNPPSGKVRSYFLNSGNRYEEKIFILGEALTSPFLYNNVHFIMDIKTGKVINTFKRDYPGAGWLCVIADLDKDGIEEIITSCDNSEVYIFDQQLTTIKYKKAELSVLAANDLNNDGKIDIICKSGDFIVLIDENLAEKFRYKLNTDGIKYLIISDIDFNGRNEIILSSNTTNLFVLEMSDNPELPAPENVKSFVYGENIVLTWEYPNYISFARFHVYRNTKPSFKIDDKFLIGSAEKTERSFSYYQETGKKYYYKVIAVWETYGDTTYTWGYESKESFSSEAHLGSTVKISWFQRYSSEIIAFAIFISILILTFVLNKFIRYKKDIVSKFLPVFKGAPVAAVIYDSGFKIRYINNAAIEIFKEVSPVKQENSIMEYFKRNNLTDWETLLNNFALNNREDVRKELILPAGKISKTLMVILRKINNSLFFLLAIDISDYLTTKNALAWTTMAHSLAHEIKNPLTSIQLALQSLTIQYLSNRPEDVKKSSVYVNSIDEDIERIRRETNRLLQFSVLSRFKKDNINLYELFRKLSSGYEIFKKQVELKIDLNPDIKIYGNGDMLELAFKNILDNSLEAISGKGSIIIRCTLMEKPDENTGRINNFTVIEISDSGCGIPKENLNKIFEPKFTTKDLGAGFGMTIVKHIVENHDGFIEVKSKAGIGTSVYITLPQERVRS